MSRSEPEVLSEALLRMWLILRRILTLPHGSAVTLVTHHLLILALLISVQDWLHLAHRTLPDLPYLAHSVRLRQRAVLAQGLHLLLFAFEDRLDLLLLVAGQVQLLGHHLEPLVGGHGLPLAVTPLSASLAHLGVRSGGAQADGKRDGNVQ